MPLAATGSQSRQPNIEPPVTDGAAETLKSWIWKKELTAVASLVGDDGLIALALNIGVHAQHPKPPLRVLAEIADDSLFKR